MLCNGQQGQGGEPLAGVLAGIRSNGATNLCQDAQCNGNEDGLYAWVDRPVENVYHLELSVKRLHSLS